MAAGIGSEDGFVSVAKGKLLASIAVAGREAGLLSEWGSGAEKFVFECIILSCVVEGVVRRFGFVVSAIDCGTEEVEFVVDGGDFDSYQHLSC